ncbi:thioredoxin-like 1-2, chloroplastic [Canna indica]|uniref:Thioredoxin-like 1-2, chloroplastic n=1 Tax=Canna indica TaxID=4628 RepID=A0AAQ3KWA9_9LILI|nr:thioredoxin-like 1-2, chloroplastic [Canna indica]
MAEALAQRGLLSSPGRHSLSPFCEKRRDLPFLAAFSPPSSLKGERSIFFGSSFHGKRLVIRSPKGRPSRTRGNLSSSSVQAVKWWETGLQPNMKEIESAEDLVDSLLNAGDKLVIVDFFSPGCGGCRALHPKICQFAELNPDVQFLQVNYEQHKSMCYSLHVHVLPFFRFYRGAHGRLCSFSCTNATIKKFKDALAKHTTDRCSLGPTKGLEESELLALAANKDLSFDYRRKPVTAPAEVAEKAPSSPNLRVPATPRLSQESEDKALAAAGR